VVETCSDTVNAILWTSKCRHHQSFEGKSGMRYCSKPSTSEFCLRLQPRESKIVDLVYFDEMHLIAKLLRNNVHRPVALHGWLHLGQPLALACTSPNAHPITLTALVVLRSGSAATHPSPSAPVNLRTHHGALTVCTIAGTSRCPASGTDTLTASKRNGHSKSCLNT
jgi:hypothetical protein